MPWWLARKAAPGIWTATLWLANKGRERAQQNLTKHEQTEFWNLLKKSGGRPGNLAQRDRTRLKNIVGKALRG